MRSVTSAFLIFIFSLFSWGREAKPIALIYQGPGTCKGCSEAVGDIFKTMGLSFAYIKPGELSPENFKKSWIYVQPGGTDRIEDTLEALSKNEIQNLKNFVGDGGRFLGICAGGYLAGAWTDTTKKRAAFGLIPSIVEEESKDSKAKLEPIIWRGVSYWVYFQGGPQFKMNEIPRAESWAVYKNTGHSAGLITQFKKGFVGLLGPHFEAQEDWYKDDQLNSPDGYHTDLAREFIEALHSKQ